VRAHTALAAATLTVALAGCGWTASTGTVAVGPGAVDDGPDDGHAPTAPAGPAVDESPAPETSVAPPPRFAQLPPYQAGEHPVPIPKIPTNAARVGDLAPAAAVPPVTVRIPGHGVTSPVVAVGIDPGTGELVVPGDPGQVGWYQFGSAPGAAGSAVLAGHVDWKGRPGAFIDLDRVRPGERVEVDLSDGTMHAFVVAETHLIAKTELPKELWDRNGPPQLVLITCGGDFDRSIHRYRQNVVVVARPA
jgi:LPXTG-site transpeptidase (sortase) family protein